MGFSLIEGRSERYAFTFDSQKLNTEFSESEQWRLDCELEDDSDVLLWLSSVPGVKIDA